METLISRGDVGVYGDSLCMRSGFQRDDKMPEKDSSLLAGVARRIATGWSSLEQPSRESVSGVYFVRNDGGNAPVAIFKPRDEEMVDEEDPVLGDFPSGYGAVREAAAYMLDLGEFACVPETRLSKLVAGGVEKEGALQSFVANIGDVDDFGPALFDLDNVQKIAAFDIRVMNADRHGGNLLVSTKGKEHKVHPIDHGMILPDTVRTLPWPVWMNWPQARQPVSEDVKKYIASLDATRDAEMLRQQLGDAISDGAIDALQCGTTLLQMGVALGMTLFDIGRLMYSSDGKSKSFLEKLLNSPLIAELESMFESDGQLEERCLAVLNRVLRQHPVLFAQLVPVVRASG